METTNLDHPFDDEAMAELRDLTHRVEVLLDRVQASVVPSVREIGVEDFHRPTSLILEAIDFLN